MGFKQMKKILCVIITTILLYIPVYSQTDTLDTDVQELFEQLIDESTEDEEEEQLFEILEELRNNPVDLNKSTLYELLQIPFLDYSSAQMIIEHRDKFGFFFSVAEINAVRELDKEIIKKVIPFLRVTIQDIRKEEQNKPLLKSNVRNYGIILRSRFIQDLQPKKGFLSNKYQGNRFKSYNRFQAFYGNDYRINILTEKDAGENSLTDFYSFNFFAKNFFFFNTIVLGDYLLEFGQGLVLWRPYGFSKGGDAVLPVMKKDRNIIPYTSADENRFFRGIAANFTFNNFSVTGFISNNFLDASIDTITGVITSIPLDGFHRTDNELRRKNKGKKLFLGGRLDYSPINNLQLSFLYSQTNFNLPLAISSLGNREESKFEHYSLSYKYFLNTISLFGETAFDGNHLATINGFIINPARNISFTSSFRSYPKNFVAFHSYGFGETSSTQNEIGFYTGIKWRTSIGLFNIYFDIFKFPSETFSNPIPTQGKEFLFDYSFKPLRNLETRFRYKNELKEISSIISGEKEIVLRDKKQIRFETLYDVSKYFRLRSRVEFNHFNIDEISTSEKGFLYFADARFSPLNQLQINSRIIFFNSDSYNSRIYEYENDLTGVMTNMALFGEGIRWYLMLRYSIGKYSLSFKYSETYKPKEKSLSSGDNEILTNIDNRISIQAEIKF